jgi:hypothetical protein
VYAHLVSPELPNLGWLCTTQKSPQVRQTQPQPGRCTSLWRASDDCQRPLVPRIVGAILPLRYTDNAHYFDRLKTPATGSVWVSNNPCQESVSA